MRDVPAASTVASGTLVSVSGFWGRREGEGFSCLSGPNEAPIAALKTCEQSRLTEKPTFFSSESWTEATLEPRVECTLAEAKRSLFTEPEQARSVFQSRSLGT